MRRGEVKSLVLLAFSDARVNVGTLATIGGAAVSYLDAIDHVLRTLSLIVTLAIGVLTVVRLMRKIRAGH